jgi:hypothetical protein
MELFNKAMFLSQQKMFALTHRRVYTLMVNLFQILNQFVLPFRKNVIEKSSMTWRVLRLVKINIYYKIINYKTRFRRFNFDKFQPIKMLKLLKLTFLIISVKNDRRAEKFGDN